MRLYEITYNGRKWETTDDVEAWLFIHFMIALGHAHAGPFKPVEMSSEPYKGEEIPNIQVA